VSFRLHRRSNGTREAFTLPTEAAAQARVVTLPGGVRDWLIMAEFEGAPKAKAGA